MIGFGQQSVKRRPIYSDATGAKLAYIVSGPEGEWVTDLKGRRIGRIKKFRADRVKRADAIATAVAGCVVVGDGETWEY